jgi:hypothetical protein
VANIWAPSKRLIAREVALGLDRVGDRSADVRTLEQSEFYVADAPAILAGDPTVALYVAAMLARRQPPRASFAAGRSAPVRSGRITGFLFRHSFQAATPA